MGGAAQLIVVRHGRTAWNAEGRFQGQADPDLDPVGWAQADAAAGAVAAIAGGLEWQEFSVVSSDLRRARSTAARIAAALGVAVTLDARLREIGLGAWEGLLEEDVARLYPSEWASWRAGRAEPRGGGESVAAGGRRVAEAVRDAMRFVDTGERGDLALPRTVVVVGHGLSLESGMAELAETAAVYLPGPPPHLDNGEVLLLPIASSPTPVAAGMSV